jgi:UDP-glucose 4-epimerase
MKTLVTGGAGFIGHNLVNELVNLNCDTIVIDNQSSNNGSNYNWNLKTSNYNFNLANLSNFERLVSLMDGVDYVFHMASDVSIPYCIENPALSFTNNLNSFTYTIEAARIAKVKKFIFSSTSAVYGLTDNQANETDSVNCLNPYSYSKFAGECLAKMYYELYQLPTVCLRYFNVYGPGQPATGQYAPVIGIFKRQKESGQPLTIVGDGSQERDFVHVSDVVSANLTVAFKSVEKYGEIYNVGTGESISIDELSNIISDEKIYLPPRIGEAKYSKANIEKIKSTYDWYPKINLKNFLSEKI